MPNWGAEIPVTIVDRKPDFVGDCDRVLTFHDGMASNADAAEFIVWQPRITLIKLLADHPYYKKDKPMIISREAAIEALLRAKHPADEREIAWVLSGQMRTCRELAKAIQRLWDLVPSERPVDNRVIAMRYAWVAGDRGSHAWDAKVLEGEYDETIIKAVETYHVKLAELEGGK